MATATEPTAAACYLSRLHLNMRSRLVQRDFANSQALHRRLLDAFPITTSRADAQMLYRVEAPRGGQGPGHVVLVQSAIEPDWTRLDAGYLDDEHAFGWSASGTVETKEVGAQFARIRSGDRFRFRLRANPTRKCHYADGDVDEHGKPRRPTGPNGTRIPLFDDTELHTWIVDKGERHGFAVPGVRWQPDPVTGDRQQGWKSDGRRLVHYAVLFEGVLEVTDPAPFRDALVRGIGPAKAYGFGLLSLAPARVTLP